MTDQEIRACGNCGYKVTFQSFGLTNRPTTQFLSIMLQGEFRGLAAATKSCPRCGKELSPQTTRAASP